MDAILRKLSLWKKFILLLGLFAVPFTAVLLILAVNLRTQEQVVEGEHTGALFFTEINRLHESTISLMFALHVKNFDEIAVQHEQLSAHYDTLKSSLKELYGDNKAVLEKLDTLFKNLASSYEQSDGMLAAGKYDDALNVLESFIDNINHLRSEINAIARLELDPEPVSFNLIKMTVLNLPLLHEDLGEIAMHSVEDIESVAKRMEIAIHVRQIVEYTGKDILLSLEKLQSSHTGNHIDYSKYDRILRKDFKVLSDHFDALKAAKDDAQVLKSMRDDIKRIIYNTRQFSIEAEKELVRVLLERDKEYTAIAMYCLFAVIIGVIVIPFIAWRIARAITHDIQQLATIADLAASQGDLTVSVPVQGSDEIAHLSRSFNLMIANLRDMIAKIQIAGDVVTNSTTEIAAVSKQQQATSAEIAATTLQIETTSKEISATSKHLVSTMEEVHKISEGTAELATGGCEGISKMEDTMTSIMTACTGITDKLAALNEKANRITTVVTTITKVADQTNLLSLNAAIEAEKAGDFGQGFSVVAREIRRLADQTAEATLDIEQVVKEMQTAVSAGVMGMERFSDEVKKGVVEVSTIGEQLNEIITRVQTLSPRFESVNEGMQTQALGAQQITEGLSQLSEAAQQTAASLHQSNDSVQHLQRASSGLAEGVARFKLRGAHVDARL
jgi:methyl-accepting chemotaxis protein WspA